MVKGFRPLGAAKGYRVLVRRSHRPAHRVAHRVTLIAVTLAVALAGCGVRGPLEAPRSAASDQAQADSGQGKKEGEAPKPHRDFILDGLLR